MNYKKCMRNNNCKTCSDYLWCKDEALDNKKKERKRKTRSQTCIKIGSDKNGFKHKTRKIHSKYS